MEQSGMGTVGLFEWTIFAVIVVAALVADLILARARPEPTHQSALARSVGWIVLALAFGAWIAFHRGAEAGTTFLTAYVLEKSLSVDNLFLFVLIFAQTGIPPALQHRALFWGVVGALAMRAVMIALGVYLLDRFHWIIYPFAALLLFSAWRMLFAKEEEKKLVEASCAICTSWVGKIIPIRPFTEGDAFLVRHGGRTMATPLLVALVVIETTDLVFALDSIPAVLAVTRDPYLVYTSNVFALLGLRSLYFVISNAIRDLRFLRPGLGVMLVFVAAKMLAGESVHVPPLVSLAVIAGIFGTAVAASLLFPKAARDEATTSPNPCSHLMEAAAREPATRHCAECVAAGDTWVRLRMCLTCGNIACCDSSRNRHALAHFQSSGHPVA
jgi:tellurite resistance protein TerC